MLSFALVVIAVLIVILLFGYNGYVVWYAKSGRYEIDRRIDAATK